jgi:hypothetical protein
LTVAFFLRIETGRGEAARFAARQKNNRRRSLAVGVSRFTRWRPLRSPRSDLLGISRRHAPRRDADPRLDQLCAAKYAVTSMPRHTSLTTGVVQAIFISCEHRHLGEIVRHAPTISNNLGAVTHIRSIAAAIKASASSRP